MKPKERLVKTIRREKVDRVPKFVRYIGEASDNLAPIFGATGHELMIKLGNDCLYVQIGINAEWSHLKIPAGETWTSEWGVTYKSKPRRHIHQLEGQKEKTISTSLFPIDCPIKEPNMSQFKFPDPDKPERMVAIRELIDKYGDDYGILVDLSPCLFEAGYIHLRGHEMFTDVVENPKFVRDFIEGMADYYARLGVNAINQGIDIIRIGDDVAHQTGLFIQTDVWREMVKPGLKRMVDSFRKANPDILIKYHCCGDWTSIMKDMVEDLGVDLIGTMQPRGKMVEFDRIKREFGDKVAFLGGLDVQQLLPEGTPEEVRDGVKHIMKTLAHNTGYVFMPSHYVMGEVPLENLWAMYEAVKEYGNYPMTWN